MQNVDSALDRELRPKTGSPGSKTSFVNNSQLLTSSCVCMCIVWTNKTFPTEFLSVCYKNINILSDISRENSELWSSRLVPQLQKWIKYLLRQLIKYLFQNNLIKNVFFIIMASPDPVSWTVYSFYTPSPMKSSHGQLGLQIWQGRFTSAIPQPYSPSENFSWPNWTLDIGRTNCKTILNPSPGLPLFFFSRENKLK